MAYRQYRYVGGTLLESEMDVIQNPILSCEHHPRVLVSVNLMFSWIEPVCGPLFHAIQRSP
jgi:hypothetical protein